MTQAVVLELPTSMASSLAITLDVLATANRLRRRLGLEAAFEVIPARVTAHGAWEGRLSRGDLLIVPGFGCTSTAELDRELPLEAACRARALMEKAASAGAVVAASCASSFLLAETGLLAGRRATTTWWLAPLFARRYPDVDLQSDRIVVVDGDFVTGGAAMAQIDVMLTMVARTAGPQIARECARYLVLDERRSQVPYMTISALVASDETLAAAERWVHLHVPRYSPFP
jgi:transcriptional regulator GlxA family with amidase domain